MCWRLSFDLLPETLREQAAAKSLAEQYHDRTMNHITTGFLGTPHLCHVLTAALATLIWLISCLITGYPTHRGFIRYKNGATTIWERWDGIKPDGSFQNITA
jgi:alpha-L-rhamnosidase